MNKYPKTLILYFVGNAPMFKITCQEHEDRWNEELDASMKAVSEGKSRQLIWLDGGIELRITPTNFIGWQYILVVGYVCLT